jgi:hypothetical protein
VYGRGEAALAERLDIHVCDEPRCILVEPLAE